MANVYSILSGQGNDLCENKFIGVQMRMLPHCIYNGFMSPDLAVKHASMNISPEGQQWESTGTTLTVNAPTVEGYTTHPLNAQSLLHKHSTMRRASRPLLSRHLQSLKRAHPPLATIQNMRLSPYHGGQGNLGPN
jgi:hypothetical protein